MTPIQAIDELTIPFAIEEVWSVIVRIKEYPTWWPWSVGLSVLNDEPEVVGSTLQLRPFGGRAFKCCVLSMEEPSRLCMEYLGGFIEGHGEWRLESVGKATRVQYVLDVRAAGRIVACVGRIIPLGKFHSMQMKSVLRQLESRVRKVADLRK